MDGKPLSRVFINYRRSDTGPVAGRLHDALIQWLPADQVFFDRDDIRGGEDWRARLRREVEDCSVMLVLIGVTWHSAQDADSGRQRLRVEDDQVRLEIEAAMATGCSLVPVLVDRGGPPAAADVPESILGLLDLQCMKLRTGDWKTDCAALQERLAQLGISSGHAAEGTAERSSQADRVSKFGWPWIVAIAVAIFAGLGYAAIGGCEPDVPPGPASGRSVGKPNERPDEIPAMTFLRKNANGHREFSFDKVPTMEFVELPAGTFEMGSSEAGLGYRNATPAHRVEVAPFLIAKTELTRAQYKAFALATDLESRYEDELQLPVSRLSWDEAAAFVRWAGLEIPSEAQWEYACRAGTTSRYWYGDGESDAARAGWFEYDSVQPVGGRPPNGFGLHDMLGNVWEWCADTWHDSYDGARTDCAAWIDDSEHDRVLRGGSHFNPAGSASRMQGDTHQSQGSHTRDGAGLRPVLRLNRK